MSRTFGRIKLLTKDEKQRLHDGARLILEQVGMKIYHKGAREYFRAFGCKVDEESLMVKFPAAVVEESVEQMRQDFHKSTRQGFRQAVRFTEASYFSRAEELHHDFTVNAGGFCTLIYDLERKRRYANIHDVHDSFKLVNALDEITWAGLPCSDQETPYSLRPVKMAAELVKYTSKIGGVEAWMVQDVAWLEEIATVVRGSKERLMADPCLVGYGESRSPLALDENMAEIFIEYVKRGFPQSLDTMPSAGTTAPATGAGTLALGLAETLAGLVLGYAVRRDAVLSLDFTGGYCDMKSLLFPYAGADRMPLLGAWVQMLKEFYGITPGVHGGKTNACEPGFQAGMEKAISTLFPLICGASGIGTIGQLEFGITFSPVQLVLDAEVVRAVRRSLAGFEINEDTLALDLIGQVGPEGNYISEPHTADHFQREFWLSDLTECLTWESYSRKKVKGMERLAEEMVREIIAGPLAPVLDQHQVAEIDRIVAACEKKLKES